MTEAPQTQRRTRLVILGIVLALAALEFFCRVGVISNLRFIANQRSLHAGGAFKVLILGDSFIADSGGLDHQLQDYFKVRGIVCLNLARGGMRPLDYLRMLQFYGSDFSPDLILMNYTLANDLSDTQRRTSREEVERWLNYRPPLARSYLWETAFDALIQWDQRRKYKATALRMKTSGIPGADTAVNPYLVLSAQFFPDSMLNNLAMYSPAALRAWDTNRTIVRKIQDLSKAGHARLLINIFPAAAQVDRSHDAFFKKIGFIMSPAFAGDRIPQERFLELCRQQRLLCNDLLPEFRRRRGEALYLESDDHWNDAGISLAFHLITDKMEALKLVPRKP